jgi:hypothetical protein
MGNFLRMRLIGCGLVLLVVGCVWAGITIYEGVVNLMHSSAAAPFKPHMAEYLASAKESEKTGQIQGKMLVIDRKTKDLDWDVVGELPADMKADKHEDIGAVVWVDYDRTKGDLVYGNEQYPSYVQTCKVTVIDHASRTIIGTASFQGGAPPSEIDENASEGVGSRPTTEIVAYLKALPRK